jgi:hypothetical protein
MNTLTWTYTDATPVDPSNPEGPWSADSDYHAVDSTGRRFLACKGGKGVWILKLGSETLGQFSSFKTLKIAAEKVS